MDDLCLEGISYWIDHAGEELNAHFPSNTSKFIAFRTDKSLEELMKYLYLLDMRFVCVSRTLEYVKTTNMKDGKFNHVFKRKS